MDSILSSVAKGKTFLFWIRPTADSSGELPKEWWLPGALGPLAILEASKDGMRIIRRSPGGTALQVGVGSALGIGLMIGVWFPIAFLIIHGLGISFGSVLFGFAGAGLLVLGILLPLSPHIRKLAGRHPQGPFVQIQVLSASLGRLHQELLIVGDGHEVRVRTNARLATITAALRLAGQMPPESEAIP